VHVCTGAKEDVFVDCAETQHFIFFFQDNLLTGSSLQDTTAADLAFMLQEKDAEIESLQAALDQREKEKLAHQEELTELRR
jgi:hypothetical protein